VTKTTGVYIDQGGNRLVVSAIGSVAYTGNFSPSGSITAGTSLSVTTTSQLTGNVTIGTGYAGTGALITAANGNIQTKGALTVATTSQLTGDVTIGTSTCVITAATGLITLDGGATNPAFKVTGAGSSCDTTAGSAYGTGTPAFCANQLALRIYIGASIYRIPVWTDG
jgi:hypothetical protein